MSAYAFYAPICDPRRRLVIEVEADGFLYNMVRNIAGTLVAVGRGKHPESWVADVLAALGLAKFWSAISFQVGDFWAIAVPAIAVLLVKAVLSVLVARAQG